MKQIWRKTYKGLSDEYKIPVVTLRAYAKAGVNMDSLEAIKKHQELKQCNRRGNPALRKQRVVDPIKIERVDGEGMDTQIKRLSTIATGLYSQYVNSLSKGEVSTATLILNDYNKVCESLRKIEVDSPKVNEMNRNVVSVSDVTKTFNMMLTRFAEDLDALPNRTAEKCYQQDKIGIIEVMKTEVEEIKKRLHETDWTVLENESINPTTESN